MMFYKHDNTRYPFKLWGPLTIWRAEISKPLLVMAEIILPVRPKIESITPCDDLVYLLKPKFAFQKQNMHSQLLSCHMKNSKWLIPKNSWWWYAACFFKSFSFSKLKYTIFLLSLFLSVQAGMSKIYIPNQSCSTLFVRHTVSNSTALPLE